MKWILCIAVVLSLLSQTKSNKPEISQHPVLVFSGNPFESKLDESKDWVGKYKTPNIYKKWFKEIAECENYPIPDTELDKIQFYYVNADSFYTPGSLIQLAGGTFPENYQIYIIIKQRYSEELIKHELLHFIMNYNGIDSKFHPPDKFETCGIHVNFTH